MKRTTFFKSLLAVPLVALTGKPEEEADDQVVVSDGTLRIDGDVEIHGSLRAGIREGENSATTTLVVERAPEPSPDKPIGIQRSGRAGHTFGMM